MKLRKRIAAMGAAVMMMVSATAMSVSAYSGSISLHYEVNATSSDNVTSNSWTYYTVSPTQSMRLTSFNGYSSSTYVRMWNPMGINANLYSSETVSVQNVKTGVQITASATLNNYGRRSSAYGSISG